MRTHEQPIPPCFLELQCAVPPHLERAVGYPLVAPPPAGPHYLGLLWIRRAREEAWLEDGRYASLASEFGYLAWQRHAAVGPYLPRGPAYDTSAGGGGEFLLVLDRLARRVYLAPADAAHVFLQGQWSEFDEHDADDVARLRADIDATAETLVARMGQLGLGGVPTPQQVRAAHAAEQELIVEMARWLDATDQARAARELWRAQAAAVVDGIPVGPSIDEAMDDINAPGQFETDA